MPTGTNEPRTRSESRQNHRTGHTATLITISSEMYLCVIKVDKMHLQQSPAWTSASFATIAACIGSRALLS
jgi:hypothetical protein